MINENNWRLMQFLFVAETKYYKQIMLLICCIAGKKKSKAYVLTIYFNADMVASFFCECY